MKSLTKFAFSAGAVSTKKASSARADITVHIAGSTAYRAAVHNAIVAVLNGGTVTAAGINTSVAGSNQAVFKGTVSGHTELGTVTVETVWTGSISGVNDLVNNPSITTWLSPSTIPSSP